MMQLVKLEDAGIAVDGDRLILENSLIRREIMLAGNPFTTVSLTNKRTGREWVRDDAQYVSQDLSDVARELSEGGIETHPALTFAGDEDFMSRFHVEAILTLEVNGSPLWEQPHLVAKVDLRCESIQLSRYYQIYPNCPVVICWTELSGEIERKDSVSPRLDHRGRRLRPESVAVPPPNADLHDSLLLHDRHLRMRNLHYTDCTDCNDNYVQEEERYSYLSNPEWLLKGSLLFAESLADGEGLFILKESPVLEDQPDHPSGDFTYGFDKGLLGQVGWGFTPEDLGNMAVISSWRTVIGVYDSTPDADAEAVKSYLKRRCKQKPERDWLLSCNQWGDRSLGENFTEEFIRKEIDACARLGIGAYMLDDGWQTGKVEDVFRILPDGSSPVYDHGDFWTINSEKFPNGLHSLFEYGKSKGVQLLFWFNPDPTDENANSTKDAEVITGLHREYQANIYKIDGVWINTRKADIRNRAFLEDVIRRSGGEISFQLDITHGARWGFFSAHHLGVLFVENRYTHWANYFPYKAHKNLWQLSKYLMPQRMLFEFLNNTPERGKYYEPSYTANDPFTPEKYPIEYCFAVVMFANPLAWFEPSNLSEEQIIRLKPVIAKYNEIRDELFSGDIYPIGEKPSGRSITGFQSHNAKARTGFVCAYREVTDRCSGAMSLRRVCAGDKVNFELIMGDGDVHYDGERCCFDLPNERSFALFRYTLA